MEKLSCDFWLKILRDSKVMAAKDHGKSSKIGQSPILAESSIVKEDLTLYSYLVGCCPISHSFGKGEPNIGSPLPNKSDIGQAADQTTVLLFPPRMLILLIIRDNYFKS